jgi:hypothetical protein
MSVWYDLLTIVEILRRLDLLYPVLSHITLNMILNPDCLNQRKAFLLPIKHA